HILFLSGSFMDDLFYDRLRRTTTWGQIGRLAKPKPPRSRWLRWLPQSQQKMHPRWLRWLSRSSLLFGKNADAAVMKVQQIKGLTLGASGGKAINAYQWCKARLSKEHPEGLLAVQRYEADSKFFRSFFVVLLILAITFVHNRHWVLIGICVVL